MPLRVRPTPPAFKAARISVIIYDNLREHTSRPRPTEPFLIRVYVDLYRPCDHVLCHSLSMRAAVANRPPTRIHFWWSHHLPTIGYPMVAYTEAALRVGYPVGLLNITDAHDAEHVLRRLAAPAERACVQRAARRGAPLTSPWYTALELLVALCAVREQRAAGECAHHCRYHRAYHARSEVK